MKASFLAIGYLLTINSNSDNPNITYHNGLDGVHQVQEQFLCNDSALIPQKTIFFYDKDQTRGMGLDTEFIDLIEIVNKRIKEIPNENKVFEKISIDPGSELLTIHVIPSRIYISMRDSIEDPTGYYNNFIRDKFNKFIKIIQPLIENNQEMQLSEYQKNILTKMITLFDFKSFEKKEYCIYGKSNSSYEISRTIILDISEILKVYNILYSVPF